MVHPYEDIDHLPKKVKDEIKQGRPTSDDKMVLKIIKRATDELGVCSIDHIIAGMYVEYKMEVGRRYIRQKLYRMKQRGYIKDTERGHYVPTGKEPNGSEDDEP
ncbi:hypothetical protein HW532_15610 [Kaustia mangrovi]|uniref:Uncharacterized protein n=1 Tax=Kaustia mangrovi TaxID=2593653 RepID=A0A7S8C5X5_9HYPH|nr:hypothetical protein [Kaustia mangrovi]QPC43991.1 hypothetical protein HW532_15610 [Kaustia mangrovi]